MSAEEFAWEKKFEWYRKKAHGQENINIFDQVRQAHQAGINEGITGFDKIKPGSGLDSAHGLHTVQVQKPINEMTMAELRQVRSHLVNRHISHFNSGGSNFNMVDGLGNLVGRQADIDYLDQVMFSRGSKDNPLFDQNGKPKKKNPVENRVEEPIKNTPVQPVQSDPRKQPSETNEQISKNIDAHTKNVDNTSSTEARQTSDRVASNEDHKKNESMREVYREVPKQESQRVVDQEEKKSTISVSDQQKEEVKVKGQKEINADVEYRKVKSGWSKMKLAGAIGLTAFGVASVLDVKKELDQDKAVERMKNIQEKEKKSRHKDERDMMKQFGYGNVDFGQMAIDMFNERIGHYKMGNSKFQ